ncbi:MAG: trehalase family glycosidase [Planctomycetota bacterium]|nr:trehalase family glycosidase [Planctomycetota bacterium]
MNPWNEIENNHKTELVGNMISSDSLGLGLGEVHCSGLLKLPVGLKITLGGQSENPHLLSRIWRPEKIVEVYKAKDNSRIVVEKVAHKDSLLVTVKLARPAAVTLSGYVDAVQALDMLNLRFPNMRPSFALRLRGTVQRGGIVFKTGHKPYLAVSTDLALKRQGLINLPEKYAFAENGKSVRESEFEQFLERRSVSDKATAGRIAYVYKGKAKEFNVVMSFSPTAKKDNRAIIRNPRSFREDCRVSWEEFGSTIPLFNCSNRNLVKRYYFSWYVLKSNVIEMGHDSRIKHPSTLASKFLYHRIFFWDSAFHALSWMWCNDPRYAHEELLNPVKNQWPTGLIPLAIPLFNEQSIYWMTDGMSSRVTQPAVHLFSAMEVYKKYGRKKVLSDIYSSIKKFDDWLWTYRDLDKDGLSSYVHMWETGTDNSPRWDRVLYGHYFEPWVESIDQNSFIYLQRQLLNQTARILGLPENAEVRKRAKLTRSALLRAWHRKDGFFYDLKDMTHEAIKVKTPAGYFPMLAGVATKSQISALTKHLLNPKEFWTTCPVPTVAKSHSSYDPKNFWRGPSWPNVNWVVIEGYVRNGRRDIAARLLSRFLNSSLERHPLICPEYFDSGNGNTLGSKHYGWGALTIDMVCRHICGIRPGMEFEQMKFTPLDIGLRSFSIAGVKIRGREVCVDYDRTKGYQVKMGGKVAFRSKAL